MTGDPIAALVADGYAARLAAASGAGAFHQAGPGGVRGGVARAGVEEMRTELLEAAAGLPGWTCMHWRVPADGAQARGEILNRPAPGAPRVVWDLDGRPPRLALDRPARLAFASLVDLAAAVAEPGEAVAMACGGTAEAVLETVRRLGYRASWNPGRGLAQDVEGFGLEPA